jgi:photosystem II stability/assembly factor-like uncharacterized protein
VPNANRFESVSFPTSLIAYAVGSSGSKGIIYKSTDGGNSWTLQFSNADSTLQSVFFVDASTGYATGNYDLVKTTDGGSTWNKSIINHSIHAGNEHIGMYCTDANTCYIPVNGIQKTTDGGTTWHQLSLPNIIAKHFTYVTSIYFTGMLNGYAVGADVDTTNFNFNGIILKTTNAGQTWNSINTIANNTTLANNDLTSVFFANSQIGYTSGNVGLTLKTTNAGGIVSGITSISSEKAVNIYPNPTNDRVTISFPQTAKQVQILNAIGETIQTKLIDGEKDLNFEFSNNGIYFVRIITDNQIITKKLVVCR